LQIGEVADSRVGPSSNDTRVVAPAATLIVQTRAEQIAEQIAEAADLTAAVDLRDQVGLPTGEPAAAGRWA
jgi:hypothetical protein